MVSQILEKGSDVTLSEDMYRSGIRVTVVGMVINVLLIILKLFGGIFGSSAAMIADAIHSASDFLTDIGVIIGLKFLSKPPDSSHAYGHGRVETVISLIMGLVIIITGFGIFRNGGHAIIHFFGGVSPVMPGVIALVMGIVSILSKEGLFWYTRFVARRVGSRSIEANAWHHRSDAFSSVGTVLGIGGAIVLGEHWTVLDPVAAVFVSFLIMKVGVDICWSAFRELSDESLSTDVRDTLETAIKQVEGIRGFHHVRTRSLGRYVTVDAHVQVDPELSVRAGHNIAHKVENAIRRVVKNAAFVTIHVEPKDDRI
ncbi:cation diffusion facilitator family transporter [bacterium]|nr:cation diffusion facilitator family transporter [bacterium]